MTRFQLPHTPWEHFADGVVHVIGVAFAIAATSALIVWASLRLPVDWIWPLTVYGVGLIATFSFSAAYNLTIHGKVRAVLRRFDHAAIYLMIAGTYTPIGIIGLGGWLGWGLAISSWTLAIVGIVMKLAFFHRWPRAGFFLYLGMGWLGIVAVWPLIQNLNPSVLILLLVGGVTYTAGTIFYHFDRLPYSRAIWHTHVLAAAVIHYVAVLMAVPAIS